MNHLASAELAVVSDGGLSDFFFFFLFPCIPLCIPTKVMSRQGGARSLALVKDFNTSLPASASLTELPPRWNCIPLIRSAISAINKTAERTFYKAANWFCWRWSAGAVES